MPRITKQPQSASTLQRRVPEATVVSVGDREADFYELFDRAAGDPAGAKLLVRATHNRKLKGECLGLKDTKRWGIEIYHRVIKSGCRIEGWRLAFSVAMPNAP